MIESYILVNTEPGKASQVVKEVRTLGWILRAEAVGGAYDVIGKGFADNVDELARFVVDEIHSIPGVIRTLTCPAATHQHLWEEHLQPAYAGR